MPVTVSVGALFEAPWGRYRVHRVEPGAGAWEVVLCDVGNPTALVGSTLAELEAGTRYTFVAAPPAAPVAAPAAPPAPRTPAGDLAPQSPVRRGGGVSRRTLGAVRPMRGMRGLLPGHDPGGRLVTVPDVEERYWLPCVKYADEPLFLDVEVIDGLEIHPRRPPVAIPHAMHITSNLSPRIRCDGCQPRPVAVDPGVLHLIREPAIDRSHDHPYAPGRSLPAPQPPMTARRPPTPAPAVPAPTLPLALDPVVLERPASDAAVIEREISAWVATLGPEPAPEPTPVIAATVPSSSRAALATWSPRWAPDLGTMGEVPPVLADTIEITVLNQAHVAIGGLTGWLARFGTDDNRIYSANAPTCWEAIAWAIDGWIRRMRREPLNLARPVGLSSYPPLVSEASCDRTESRP